MRVGLSADVKEEAVKTSGVVRFDMEPEVEMIPSDCELEKDDCAGKESASSSPRRYEKYSRLNTPEEKRQMSKLRRKRKK